MIVRIMGEGQYQVDDDTARKHDDVWKSIVRSIVGGAKAIDEMAQRRLLEGLAYDLALHLGLHVGQGDDALLERVGQVQLAVERTRVVPRLEWSGDDNECE